MPMLELAERPSSPAQFMGTIKYTSLARPFRHGTTAHPGHRFVLITNIEHVPARWDAGRVEVSYAWKTSDGTWCASTHDFEAKAVTILDQEGRVIW